MQDIEIKNRFFQLANFWLCDSYSICIRYLALRKSNSIQIINASLAVLPEPPMTTNDFELDTHSLLAGQITFVSLSKVKVVQLLMAATDGKLNVHGLSLCLEKESQLNFYSDIPHNDTWFFNLNILISGAKIGVLSSIERSDNDALLRQATPPFDGITDLENWLQLKDSRSTTQTPTISISVSPPADIDLAATSLKSIELRLKLIAHSKFDVAKIDLAIREFPGRGIATRKQVASSIKWGRVKNNRREGILDLQLANADNLFAVLTINSHTVRRQWFLDPDKSANTKYVATQLFDKELKQLKAAVINPTDSVRFEKGIASLLFLLGFSPALQVETQAPDILVTTPAGQLAIVECTIKISDFENKIGKLVERRNALIQSLESIGHNIQVSAFLICSLPRTQIAVEDSRLIHQQVTLLCQENINEAFHQLRTPKSPDEMLNNAANALAKARHLID